MAEHPFGDGWLDDSGTATLWRDLITWLKEETDNYLADPHKSFRGPNFDFNMAEHLLANLCASPLEQAMLIALLRAEYGIGSFFGGSVDLHDGTMPFPIDDTPVVIAMGMQIEQYRPDFLVIAHWKDARLIIDVEVDGRDNHLPEDRVAHDKRRDRFMASRGIRVMRFPGTEVYSDTHACASEVADIVHHWWYPKFQSMLSRS